MAVSFYMVPWKLKYLQTMVRIKALLSQDNKCRNLCLSGIFIFDWNIASVKVFSVGNDPSNNIPSPIRHPPLIPVEQHINPQPSSVNSQYFHNHLSLSCDTIHSSSCPTNHLSCPSSPSSPSPLHHCNPV